MSQVRRKIFRAGCQSFRSASVPRIAGSRSQQVKTSFLTFKGSELLVISFSTVRYHCDCSKSYTGHYERRHIPKEVVSHLLYREADDSKGRWQECFRWDRRRVNPGDVQESTSGSLVDVHNRVKVVNVKVVKEQREWGKLLGATHHDVQPSI